MLVLGAQVQVPVKIYLDFMVGFHQVHANVVK